MPFEYPYATLTQVSHIRWRLERSMVYWGNYESFTVPKGFSTDLASVPRLAAWLIPRYGVYTPAAILHDYLCIEARKPEPIVSRADADGLFRRCLRELGVSVPRRWMMWAAVRAASAMSGARGVDWLWFLLITIPSVLFIAIPAIIVQLWLVVFWLVEWAWWGLARNARKKEDGPRPPVFPQRI